MKRGNESGFVLVTALVLLAILTLAGITSSYKSVVEIKVSRMSVDLDRAMQAASTGLTQMYWSWSQDGDEATAGTGRYEFKQIKDFLGGATAPVVYVGDLTPNSVGNVTDATIQANTGIKVFTILNTGVTDAYTWLDADAGSYPQVAVWMTTFTNLLPPAYPYAESVDLGATPTGCDGGKCRLVTYALGRAGNSRRLLRESQAFGDLKLTGVSAMTNAASGESFKEVCGVLAADATPGVSSNSKPWGTEKTGNVVIDATQAPYLLGNSPSGVAIASNTEVDGGGKNLRNGTDTTTGMSFEDIPVLLYSGHGATLGVKADFADMTSDTTGADLPADLLPENLLAQSLIATDKAVNYFQDPNQNLFSIDHYRWAAEQFTCQDPTQPDGQSGNGLYCSKAEKLRLSLVAAGYPAVVPVTGRLSAAQLQYNVAHSIPMFGITRAMLPAMPTSTQSACNGKNITLYKLSDYKIKASGAYDGDASDPYNVIPDTDGKVGPTARFLAYGTLILDFFADDNIDADTTATSGLDDNGKFDPAGGERILTPMESVDVYRPSNVPMYINPVMPRFAGTTPLAWPTAAAQSAPSGSTSALSAASEINMVDAAGSSAKLINLASPYDGYFPWSEGMLPSGIGVGNAGTMRLMDRDSEPDNALGQGIIDTVKSIKSLAAGAQVFSSMTGEPAVNMLALLALPKPFGTGTEAKVLKYYHRLMVATADQQSANDWPIAPWPGDTFASNFCIGREDCGASTLNVAPAADHMGDKLHLLFPSAYAHGWKVSLAALDMKASEWNNILSGMVGQYDLLEAEYAAPTGNFKQGLPFSKKDDGFINRDAVIALSESAGKYFHATEDATTGYVLLDSNWADIPSTIYSGGLIDFHSTMNMSGAMYTPGPLEWGTGKSGYDSVAASDEELSYANGSIITGFGAAISYSTDVYISHLFLAFDPSSVDNVNTNNQTIVLRRYDWQQLP